MLRRIAITFLALLTLAGPCTAVLAQDFDFPASSTWNLRGITSRINLDSQGGAVDGVVSFDTDGLVTGGNITYTGGFNASVTGTFTAGSLSVDGRALEGSLLTSNITSTSMYLHGFAATDELLFFATENTDSVPDRLGMLVGVKAGGSFNSTDGPFNDLASSVWRFKALASPFLPTDSTGGWGFGFIELAANRSVAGGSITIANGDPDGADIPADGERFFNIDAAGRVTGSFDASVIFCCSSNVVVDGYMSPDKTLIVATFFDSPEGAVGSGLVILQREPAPTFLTANLEGTFDLVGAEQYAGQDNVGAWVRGNITFTSGGNISAGTFFDAYGDTQTPTGTITIDSNGFVGGSVQLGDDIDPLELHALMTADKKMIIGVYTRVDDGENVHTALFTLVRRPSTASTVAFSSATYSRLEGNTTATITVQRAGDTSGTVTVDFTTAAATTGVPATAFNDYVPTSGTLTFGPEVTMATFTVAILDDTAVEPTERVKLILSNPTNGATLGSPSEAHLLILDNDSIVQFSAATYSRGENAGATSINVTRTGYRGNTARVRYTISGGTATRGSDYTAPLTALLTFGPGVASVPLPFTILQDTLAEGPETINFVLSNPTGNMQLGPTSSAVVTITDDDVAGTLAFSSARYTATEGGPGAVITVVRSGGSAGGVTVRFATSNGTATAGADYTARSGTLTFGAGQMSRTFTVPILDDSTGESTETVHLELSNPGGGAVIGAPSNAVLMILDNEPIIGFTGRWVGNGLEVERTGRVNLTSQVNYSAIDGTATAGLDYVALSGTLTFGPGVRIRIIPITIRRDTLVEGDETFTVLLSDPVRARLGQTVRQVVIKDND